MNAPAIDSASIEHLDHEPECSGCGKTAIYATDSHGCAEEFICEMCLLAWRTIFSRRLYANGGHCWCRSCAESFTRFEDFVTAVPL